MDRSETTNNYVRVILPGDPEFNGTLSQLPPAWESQVNAKGCFGFVPDAGAGGVLRSVNNAEFQDYVLGGEYEQHQQNLYGDMYVPPTGLEWCEADLDGVEEFLVDW
jgi:hypothetical protein